MSGNQMTKGGNTPGGSLQPMDASEPPQGGVFRLEGLEPGASGEEGIGTPRKPKVSTQALTLGVLLLAGAGLIYGMRLLGIGPLTTLAKTAVPEYDLTRSPSAKAADHKRILKDLEANHAASQVPVDQVQKNPFMLAMLIEPEPVADNTEQASRAAADKAKRELEAKRRRVQSTLASLKINGIIGGSNPVARISGEAVRVGDTVGDLFTVKAIHGRSVELAFEDDVFTLEMDDDERNSNKPGRKK